MKNIYEGSPNKNSIKINNYEFRLTCVMFPEQYDVYKNDEQIAYVRLRGGELRVDYKECGGLPILYTQATKGDGYFEGEKERMYFLNLIVDLLEYFLESVKQEPPK